MAEDCAPPTGGTKVAAAEAADAARIGELARTHHAALMRYFMRRGIPAADAQDLTQELFTRLSQQGALAQVEHVERYLFGTAANLALGYSRQRRVRACHAPENYLEAVQRTESFTPAEVLESQQELNLIMAALSKMPARMRGIFVLARLENVPRAEIAARLGISKRLVEKEITIATAILTDLWRGLS